MPNVAVIYYSSTGNVHALAEAVADGAAAAGAIDSNPAWRKHLDATASVEIATVDDIRWADALAFGSPTRFGNVSAQLKQFLDSTGPLWAAGELADKAATGFTGAGNPHGGQESTLLALYNTMHHWGAIVVAPGYTDQSVYAAGGNPYGTSHAANEGLPNDAELAAARYQGRRLTRVATALAAHRLHPQRLAA